MTHGVQTFPRYLKNPERPGMTYRPCRTADPGVLSPGRVASTDR